MGVDILGVDILGVDILRLTRQYRHAHDPFCNFVKELSDRLPAAENRNNKFKLTTQQGHIVMQKCIYNCFVQYDINRKIPLIDYTFRVSYSHHGYQDSRL